MDKHYFKKIETENAGFWFENVLKRAIRLCLSFGL